jgi:hypothetical protein
MYTSPIQSFDEKTSRPPVVDRAKMNYPDI